MKIMSNEIDELKDMLDALKIDSSKDCSNKAIEQIQRILLLTIGENPDREGLVGTPARIRRSWEELYKGYAEDPKEILSTSFTETVSGGEDPYDQIVLLSHIEFHSMCEHHMLPFSGVAHVAYIPKDGKAVGISKLARLVDCYSRRLQIQERMTSDIAFSIQRELNPLGVAVVVNAHHSCMGARGVKKPTANMVTSRMLGAFKSDGNARSEFFKMIELQRKSL